MSTALSTNLTDIPGKLAFLILPGFPMACLTSAIEPLRAANEISGSQAFEWMIVGEALEPVPSSAKVNFSPDVTLADIAHIDALYLLSPPLAQFANPRSANAHMRQLERRGVTLGGFSGGVFPLCRAGLMLSCATSVHWVYKAAFHKEFPNLPTTENVIALGPRRETASGAAAVFDLMLMRIEKELGAEVMTEVACWFQHPFVRDQTDRQKVPTLQSASTEDMLPETVAKAVAHFAENIEQPLRIATVAELIGVSTRQMDRAFHKATGQSPLKYYRMMRLDQARQMARHTSDSLEQIAGAVGFASTSAFTRRYKEAYGQGPLDERRSINSIRVAQNKPVPSN